MLGELLGITWGLQRKSLRSCNSACSAPSHAKVEVAGLTNDLYTKLSGFSKKVLSQLAVPIIKVFQIFPRFLCKGSFTALLSTSVDLSFCCTVCSAVKYQMLLQFCAQSFCQQSLKNSRRPLQNLLISERELAIFHVVQITN